jgi:hypothetical protein
MPKLNIKSAEATTDGLGLINFLVEGQEDGGTVIPGTNGTVQLTVAQVQAILAKPTGAEKKTEFANCVALKKPSLSDANLQAKIDANANAQSEETDLIAALPLPLVIDAT